MASGRRSLRMKPDRVIVGEVPGRDRDHAERDEPGNDGSLSTIHANSSWRSSTGSGTYAIQSPSGWPTEATMMLIRRAIRPRGVVERRTSTRTAAGCGDREQHPRGERVDGRVLSSEVFAPGRTAGPAAAPIACLDDLVAVGTSRPAVAVVTPPPTLPMLLAVLAGGVAGAGLVLLLVALRGTDPAAPAGPVECRPAAAGLPRRLPGRSGWRFADPVITRWPVAALAAAG